MANFEIKDGVAVIPEGTQVIAWEFRNRKDLVEVTLPEGLREIKGDAFEGCINLKSIHIPASVKKIGSHPCKGCVSLVSITVAEGNTCYDSREGCNAIIYDASQSVIRLPAELVQGCSATVIPESVRIIKNGAFNGHSRLESIKIPSSVTSIGEDEWGVGAFEGCSGLKEISIPSSVSLIKNNSFRGCSALESIVVEDGNRKYDSRENCNAVIETESGTLVAGCSKTKVPSGVVKIGHGAFYECGALKDFVIPQSVCAIEAEVFHGCSGLVDLMIPEGVKEIGAAAFRGCKGLRSVSLPEGLEKIGHRAFCECHSLESISIPGSVREIGLAVFAGCDSLASIEVHPDNAVYDSREGCNAIIKTDENLLVTYSLSAIIPDTVKKLAEDALCGGQVRIAIPKGITSIPMDFFAPAYQTLETVVLPVGVSGLPKETFEGLPALKAIYVPVKKSDYYKKRIPEKLHDIIVEHKS